MTLSEPKDMASVGSARLPINPAAGENAGAKVTANAPSLYAVSDLTMSGWEVEVTHADGWDFAQIASTNTRSHLTIEADDGDGQVPFTGWRVTLDRERLALHIKQCQDVLARLP